jgi:hypothetical protein
MGGSGLMELKIVINKRQFGWMGDRCMTTSTGSHYFHNVRHPQEMAEPEINCFLTHLAVKEKVSASTQNQALSALLCSFTAKRLPVVMIRDEVKAMLANLTGDKWMMASMM